MKKKFASLIYINFGLSLIYTRFILSVTHLNEFFYHNLLYICNF